MGYLKQHCFTVDNVKEFFLSPYTYIVNRRLRNAKSRINTAFFCC